jgi:hypothetical protein
MKKFEIGKLASAKINQQVRILEGALADYNKKWTVVEKHRKGIRLESGSSRQFFYQDEAELVDVEAA